jgi:hypothetical protein
MSCTHDCNQGRDCVCAYRASKFEQFKIRAYFAWQVLIGKCEPTPIVQFYPKNAAKDAALNLALETLEQLGKRPRGGSVGARAAHSFIVTQLQAQGAEL